MSKDIHITIIIPVYNAVHYIDECVISVLDQSYNDYDIILVDDGSTDGSSLKCEEYAQRSNISVIHKNNGGAADSRNLGLQTASGDYVWFIDGDDKLVDNYCLDRLVNIIIQYPTCDYIGFNMNYYWNDEHVKPQKSYNHKLVGTINRDIIIKELVCSGTFSVSPCTKIFKTSFLKDNNISFPKGIVGEDYVWFYILLEKCSNIHYENIYLYNYRKSVVTSVSGNMTLGKYRDFLSVLEFMLKFLEESEFQPDVKKALYSFTAYFYCTLLGEMYYMGQEERVEFQNRLQTYKWLLDFDQSPKVRFSSFLAKLCGLRITSCLFYLYIKWFVRKNT